MKTPSFILIETMDIESSQLTIGMIRNAFLQDGLKVNSAALPSEGPLGHLRRVLGEGRIQFDFYAEQSLAIIDCMDFFLNPLNGMVKNNQEFDMLLLNGSFAKAFSASAEDKEHLQWLKEICKILPAPNAIILFMDAESARVDLSQCWETAPIITPDDFLNNRTEYKRQWLENQQC